MDISRLKNLKIIGLTKDFLLILAIFGKTWKKKTQNFVNVEKTFWSNGVKTVENSENSLYSSKFDTFSQKW